MQSTREADRAQWAGARPVGWGAVMDELGCQQRVEAAGEFDAESCQDQIHILGRCLWLPWEDEWKGCAQKQFIWPRDSPGLEEVVWKSTDTWLDGDDNHESRTKERLAQKGG